MYRALAKSGTGVPVRTHVRVENSHVRTHDRRTSAQPLPCTVSGMVLLRTAVRPGGTGGAVPPARGFKLAGEFTGLIQSS
jgi:hypothetical protein